MQLPHKFDKEKLPMVYKIHEGAQLKYSFKLNQLCFGDFRIKFLKFSLIKPMHKKKLSGFKV